MTQRLNLSTIEWPAGFGLGGDGRGDVGPEQIGALVGEDLFDRHREIFAVLDLPVEEIARRILSWARVNAPAEPVDDVRLLMAWADRALLELIERGVVKFVLQTPEADANLEVLRSNVVTSGLRPAPATTVTEGAQPIGPIEEDLDAAIITDWKTLQSSEVRSKMRDPQYKSRLEALMASGRI